MAIERLELGKNSNAPVRVKGIVLRVVYQFDRAHSVGIAFGSTMTAGQYSRIEALLVQAEEITLEHPLLTPQGRKAQADLRALLTLITAEKLRAEKRESINGNETKAD